ncbi:MAG: glycosyltransferase family 4 protein [Candidatus Bathyarchaeota archaeon]|nr:glycosyltransferase family 4 protein [Candidatus Bathyarchaeota archaeon]
MLHVCPRYYPNIGGVEDHVKNIAERLAEKHDVSVFTTASEILPREEIINGVQVRRFKAWSPNDAYYFSRELKRSLLANSQYYDIIHAHNYHAFPALYAAQAKKNGNKLAFTPHYHGEGHTRFRDVLHVFYKLCGRAIFRKSDKIVCVSDYEKRLVMKNFRIHDTNISVIPNGINFKEFEKFEQRKEGHSKIILYVGRLEKYKGVHYLIKVLKMLSNDYILEIVGQGSYEKSLVNLAKDTGVENRVKFYKALSRKQLLQKYAGANVFALLSKHEAFGISVAEALASKCPCVVANISALKEWIDYENCFGVEYPIKIDKLAKLIAETIFRRVTHVRLWDWTEVTNKLIELYTDLIYK